jgi:diguanylate cyclase (GGDEF)-like protein/PAS domain S-box-containing protein
MIRWLLRWPSQVSLVAVLVVTALLASVVVLTAHRQGARQDARRDTEARMEQLAHGQARRLIGLAETRDALGLQRAIGSLALTPDVIGAWWVDAEGRVRGSLLRRELGRPLGEVLRDSGLAPDAVDAIEAIVFQAADHSQVLGGERVVAATPLRLSPALGGEGHLILLGDAEGAFRQGMAIGYQRLGVQWFVIGLLGVILWSLLQRLWVRRSRALQAYAQAIQHVEAEPPVLLEGGDELADITRAVAATGRVLHADARMLRALNECSRLVLRYPDLPTLLPAIRRVLVEQAGFVAVSLLLVERGSNSRRIRREGGDDVPGLPDRLDLDAPGDAARELAEALDDREARGVTLAGRRAVVLPLAGPDRLLGALVLMGGRAEAMGEETLDVLSSIAADLSLTLAHQRTAVLASEANQRFAAALAAADLGTWERDRGGGVLRANDRWFAILGRTPEPAIPLATWQDWLQPDDAHALSEAEGAALASNDTYELDLRVKHADGHWVWVHEVGRVVARDADGLLLRVRGVTLDSTERRRSEASRRLAGAIVDNTREGILVCNADGVILSVNRAFERLTGYPSEEIVGHRASVLSSGLHDSAFYGAMWDSLAERGHWEGEIWNRRRNGEVFPEWLSISRIPGDHLDGACYVGQFADLTERQEVQRRLDLLSRSDPLTGLDNRRSFLQAVAGALVENPAVAVLAVNLDGFRQVNQSLGMEAGDAVLRIVADRLRATVPAGALLGRVEGDLFAIGLPGGDTSAAHQHAESLYAAFRTPITVADAALVLGLSIGVAAAPEHGGEAETLLVAAGAAVHEAHESGRNTVAVYVPGRSAVSRERLAMESQLRLALQAGELYLVFQPQVALHDGHLIGIEALVRWRHPTRGIVAPGAFIGIAEDTGLIVPLGEFVLREACQAAMRLRLAGLPAVPVSVNVSALQFRRDGFMPTVQAALQASGLTPSLLELELTESVLMRGTDDMLARMHIVREAGVRIAIDDFGTGFSSLAYLSRMGLDRLKIDQAFVRDMRQSARAEGIVKAIIAMAKHLQLDVIAEGVEEAEDAAHLLLLGCDDAQGYFYGRPMEEAALLDWARGSGRMPE